MFIPELGQPDVIVADEKMNDAEEETEESLERENFGLGSAELP